MKIANFFLRKENSICKMIKILSAICIVLIVLLELWNTGYAPSDMEGDQNQHALVSFNIINGAKIDYGCSFSPYAYLYPYWQFLLAIMFRIFGATRAVTSIFTILIGLFAIIFFSKFAKKLPPAITPLATLFFASSLALLPYWIYGMGHLALLPLGTLSTLFFYYKMVTCEHDKLYTHLTAISLGLSIAIGYAHILILYPIILLCNFFVERGLKRVFNLKIFYVVFSSMLIYMVITFLFSKFMYHTSITEYFKQVWIVLNWRFNAEKSGTNSQFIDHLRWLLGEFFNKSKGDRNGDFNVFSVLGYPYLSPAMGVLFVAGLVYSWIKRDNFSRIINVWLFVTVTAYTVLINPVPRYLVILIPCVYLFIGLGLEGLYCIALKFNKSSFSYIVFIILLFYEFVNFNKGYADYYSNNSNLQRFSGIQEASKLINEDLDKNKKIQLVIGDPFYTVPNLFFFYTKERLTDKIVEWKNFKTTLDTLHNGNYFFTFSANEPALSEFQQYFQAIEPYYIVYTNDSKECRYIYKLSGKWILSNHNKHINLSEPGLYNIVFKTRAPLSKVNHETIGYVYNFNKSDVLNDWTITKNNIEKQHEINSKQYQGLNANIPFEGNSATDEWIRMERKINIDLFNYDSFEILYRVDDPSVQTFQILADLDFNNDGIVDGVVQTYTSNPVSYTNTFSWNILQEARNKYEYMNFTSCKILRLEIYFHKLWNVDCSGGNKKYNFLLKHLLFYKSSRQNQYELEKLRYRVDFSNSNSWNNTNYVFSIENNKYRATLSKRFTFNLEEADIMRAYFSETPAKKQTTNIYAKLILNGTEECLLIDSINSEHALHGYIDYNIPNMLFLDDKYDIIINGIEVATEKEIVNGSNFNTSGNIDRVEFLKIKSESPDIISPEIYVNGRKNKCKLKCLHQNNQDVEFICRSAVSLKNKNVFTYSCVLKPKNILFYSCNDELESTE